MTGRVRSVLLGAVFLLMCASTARAQAIGSIFGKVTDSTGAVLPGVTVTVTGTGLQRPLVQTTTASGAYQFTSVPIGTYTVAFELSSFKKAVRQNIIITNGFNAQVDQKLEVGQMSEEMTVSAAPPVVDTKKTITGATFTSDVLEKIPTARDPWQIVNMTPGVAAGLNVGGSSSGQQVGLASRGTSSNVQWNLEGGSITDLSSNSSPSYFNFDSLDQIQVTNGGGDVSVQSSGLSINLVTKSGSNVFKGNAHGTFENENMESNNVTQAQFTAAGANSFLSGNPVKKIDVFDVDYGGPIVKNKLWFWGSWDRQDINDGIANFFDPKLGSFCGQLDAAVRAQNLSGSGLISYDKLNQIQKCLGNDLTLIKDIDWKINYQINASNKVQWLFTSDNKYRNHRGSSATTAIEATTQQTSDAPWKFPLPTHQLTHTWIASDRLVFNNQVTYVGGGFFLDYQDVPPQGSCKQTRYNGATDNSGYETKASCLWNTQSLFNDTTGVSSRSLYGSYQTVRHSWEAKTDGTYFLSNKLGGDHSLKFGLGWRKNPILSFTHYGGGANAQVQCIGDSDLSGCGTGAYVTPGSATGIVPFAAVLSRDQLRNNSWWTYNGYIQDGYAKGRIRLNGGVRYDWQQSKSLGGCVPANELDPSALPSQCEQGTQVDPQTGKKIRAFSNWSPRVSATYDLLGNGKTQIHGSYSYYYDTKITLANALTGLFTTTSLTWGPNNSDGTCAAGGSCWTDANMDGIVQLNELIGTPSSSSSRFVNGVLQAVGNNIDPNAQIGRTREGIVGVEHELISNLAVGADFIYRKYDHGTASYTIGYQPGGPNGSLSALYTGPLTYTDPTTGISAPYYVICQGCSRPSGIGSIAVTNPNWEIYKGVDLTATKRFSHRWQMQTGLTMQRSIQHYPADSANCVNPTGCSFINRQTNTGSLTGARYLYKLSGSYVFPFDINVAANYNLTDGAVRILTIRGPGQVYGGTTGKIRYSTLTFQNAGTTRLPATSLLDVSVQKSFKMRGGKDTVKLMLDGFNILNANMVTGYSSNEVSLQASNQPRSIVPPRIFRVGFGLTF